MDIIDFRPRPVTGGFRVRQASHEDVDEIAAMRVLAWRQAYTGMVDDVVFEQQETRREDMAAQIRAQMDRGSYHWVVVGRDGRIVGWAVAGGSRDDDAPEPLELFAIYLLDEAKGSGIADRLLQTAIGDAPAYLWVVDGNARARAFYERHGFRTDGRSQSLPTAWRGAEEIRMVRRTAS